MTASYDEEEKIRRLLKERGSVPAGALEGSEADNLGRKDGFYDVVIDSEKYRLEDEEYLR